MAQSWKLQVPRAKLASVVPLSTPFLAIVDVANVCNFKCNFCFQSVEKSKLKDMGFRPAMMDMDLFKKTMEQLKAFPEQLKRLYLFAHGESLLNKNLPRMIALAKKLDIARTIQITTNGSLLTPQLNVALVEAGLDELRISIEGLSSERYREVAGVDFDFEKFVDNIKHFYEHRGACKLYIKAINIALDGQEKAYHRLFADMCDNISVEYVTPYYKGVQYDQLFEQHDKGILGSQRKPISVCPRIFYMLNICPDGNVTMCNVDNLEQHVFGNVATHSLVDLWNGKEFTDLRVQHLENKGREHPLCDSCVCLENCSQPSDILDNNREEILERLAVYQR